MKDDGWRRRLIRFLGGTPEDKSALLKLLRELQGAQKSEGYLNARELEMIEGVLSMRDWQIRDVMIPKNDIVGLSARDDYRAAVLLACENEHSRYPVFAEDGEHVCGVLLAKDLLRFVDAPEKFKIREVMRPPIFQPLSKNLDAMLDDFRRRRTHLAVVVDEYESPAGIVTIEDVLERIVGEIEDEYDDEDDKPRTLPDGATIIKGAMSMEEFNAYFNSSLPEDAADTVAGWLAAEIGRLPEQSHKHRGGGFAFEVLEADDRRVYTLKVSLEESES